MFYHFLLWNDKGDKIKRKVMISEPEYGGLKMIVNNNGNWKLLFDLELKMNGCEFIISMSLTLRKEFGLRTVLVQLFSKDR